MALIKIFQCPLLIILLQADVKCQNGKMLAGNCRSCEAMCFMTKGAFTSVVMVKENSDSLWGVLMISHSKQPCLSPYWTLIVHNDIYSAFSMPNGHWIELQLLALLYDAYCLQHICVFLSKRGFSSSVRWATPVYTKYLCKSEEKHHMTHFLQELTRDRWCEMFSAASPGRLFSPKKRHLSIWFWCL